MQRPVQTFFHILFELIALVVLLGLIAAAGKTGKMWQLTLERDMILSRQREEIGILRDIANTNKLYSPSEVSEIIVEYGSRFEFVVDSSVDGVKGQHYIFRDSETHNKAQVEARNLLNSGRYKSVNSSAGLEYEFVDDYMWSTDFLMDNVCLLDENGTSNKYKVEILTPSPLIDVIDWSNPTMAGNFGPNDGTSNYYWFRHGADDPLSIPENVISQTYRIYYTPAN